MSEATHILVCGTTAAEGAQQARCAQCNAIIWPTRGSLEYARVEQMPTICVDCFFKIEDFDFAGFIDQGTFLPQSFSEILFEEIFRYKPLGNK